MFPAGILKRWEWLSVRHNAVTDVLVDLVDTLTDDFDVIDFFHVLAGHCVELLEVDAAGVLLALRDGRLQVVASADERPRTVELFQLQVEEGPGLDAWRTGTPIGHPDLAAAGDRWPRLAAKASAAGFAATCALPMRLHRENVGVLSLLKARAGELDGESLGVAKALVDLAGIGLLQARAAWRHEVLLEQLEHALTSRVVLEQAKGFVADRTGTDITTAFTILRSYARINGRGLTDVADAVVARSDDVRDLFP